MKLSILLLLPALAILAVAVPLLPAQEANHIENRQAIEIAMTAISWAKDLIKGFASMISKASPTAHLKKMAKTQPTRAQKDEWIACWKTRQAKGEWFREAPCGKDAKIQMMGDKYQSAKTCFGVTMLGMGNAIEAGAVHVEIDHHPALAKCWAMFKVESLWKDSRAPEKSENAKIKTT